MFAQGMCQLEAYYCINFYKYQVYGLLLDQHILHILQVTCKKFFLSLNF